MRINGFEQIKAFYSWVFENPDKVRPSHISLYLFLWNQNNRANWVEWFKCPYDLAMQGACIGSKSTYYKALDQLEEWKLIEYKKGINNFKAPQIKLIQLYKSGQVTEQPSVPLSEPLTEQPSVPLPSNIYKLVTDNLELVSNNLEKWIKSEQPKDVKELNISFEVFWDLYDKKVGGRTKPEKKWNSLKDSEREKIIETLPLFKSKIRDKQYQPHPLTYLNNERWNDDLKEEVKRTYISLPNLQVKYMNDLGVKMLTPEQQAEVKRDWETNYKPLL